MRITVDLPADELRRVLRELHAAASRDVSAATDAEAGERAAGVLTRRAAARLLGVSVRSFDRLVAAGKLRRYEPPFGRPGYLEADVLALREAHAGPPLRVVVRRRGAR